MDFRSIPCRFPNCDCPEPRLHIGAVKIAERLLGDASAFRPMYTTKGLPIQKMGSRLFVRECAAKAFIEGRLK